MHEPDPACAWPGTEQTLSLLRKRTRHREEAGDDQTKHATGRQEAGGSVEFQKGINGQAGVQQGVDEVGGEPHPSTSATPATAHTWAGTKITGLKNSFFCIYVCLFLNHIPSVHAV